MHGYVVRVKSRLPHLIKYTAHPTVLYVLWLELISPHVLLYLLVTLSAFKQRLIMLLYRKSKFR
jgi:hypothetical protein